MVKEIFFFGTCFFIELLILFLFIINNQKSTLGFESAFSLSFRTRNYSSSFLVFPETARPNPERIALAAAPKIATS